MDKKQSLQKKLVQSIGKTTGNKNVVSATTTFNQKLLHHPDPEKAAEMVGEQTGLVFDTQHVAISEHLKLDMVDINARYKRSEKLSLSFDEKERHTKPTIKKSDIGETRKIEKTSWADWLGKDKFLIIFTGSLLITSMFMGAANVFANLISSGVAVFIEKPMLAYLISALVPIASSAIKFATNFMQYDTSRRRYIQSLFFLTIIVILTWVVVFAFTYAGVSGDIDWSQYDEENPTGSILVLTQLLAEVLVSSVLFLAVEDIYLRYAPPELIIDNPEYLDVKNARIAHQKVHNILRQERGEKHGQIIALEAARQVYINEQIADYVALRARFDAVNNFNA